jgi:hypothetical protein
VTLDSVRRAIQSPLSSSLRMDWTKDESELFVSVLDAGRGGGTLA